MFVCAHFAEVTCCVLIKRHSRWDTVDKYFITTRVQGATMKVFLDIINKNTCKKLNIHGFVMMDAERDPSVKRKLFF